MNVPNVNSSLESVLPANLGEAIDPRSLMRIAFEAVDAAVWPRPAASVPVGAPEPVLRTLVAYCYCSAIFATREIEAAARFDANVRYLCANDFPTWQQLRQFCRRERKYLRETLARMIQAVATETGAHAAPWHASLLEADRRLRLAIEADSAAMDD